MLAVCDTHESLEHGANLGEAWPWGIDQDALTLRLFHHRGPDLLGSRDLSIF